MKQKQFLMDATGGAVGDLRPQITAALGVRDRGHHITFIGDRSVGRALSQLGVGVPVLPSPACRSGNRVKMIKRQMFGRAKFDVLRKRVLLAS
jgi:hypothetical protein